MKQLVFTVALVGAASPVFAQNPKFEFGKSEEVEKVTDVEWTASAEAGVVFTTGNSDTTTVSAGARSTRKTGKNKFSAEANLTYARSSVLVHVDDGNGLVDDESEIESRTQTTAETVTSKLRYDRFLTKHNSLFVAAIVSRDLPAGKESVFGGQLGYSRLLFQTKQGDKVKSEAVAEIGYDFARENLVAGDPIAIHSARAFVGYKSEMTEGTNLEASVEALTNLLKVTLPTGKDGGPGKDTRINFRIAVSSKIGKSLAVQTSIEAKYDHRPAPLVIKDAMLAPGFVPEASKTDTVMKASLIYNFF